MVIYIKETTMATLCNFHTEINPNKMYRIVFELTVFWMFANVLSVEVRRDEKVSLAFQCVS